MSRSSRSPRSFHALVALALATGALVAPAAWAASSASSASSEGSSASVGSSSTSIEQSSASSSPGDKKAEGPYRIVHVAAADTQPGKVRLALKAVNGEHEFALLLPQETFAKAGLEVGGVITAKARDYGMQFAVAGEKEPFFLVVDDARFDELKTRVVKG
jgi:hypothetical protein